jgi:hypothetical protein
MVRHESLRLATRRVPRRSSKNVKGRIACDSTRASWKLAVMPGKTVGPAPDGGSETMWRVNPRHNDAGVTGVRQFRKRCNLATTLVVIREKPLINEPLPRIAIKHFPQRKTKSRQCLKFVNPKRHEET